MAASLALLLLALLIGGFALRFLRPKRWARPEVRRGYLALLAVLLPAWICFFTGIAMGIRPLAIAGLVVTGTSVVTLLPLALALGAAELLQLAGKRLEARWRARPPSRPSPDVRTSDEEPLETSTVFLETSSSVLTNGSSLPSTAEGQPGVDPVESYADSEAGSGSISQAHATSGDGSGSISQAASLEPEPSSSDLATGPGTGLTRRAFLLVSRNAVPAASLSVSGAGLLFAAQEPLIPRIPLRFPDLPPALEGLRILQLSDLHLGWFVNLPDLEALLERVAPSAPDLIVFTGDIADDLHQLEPALALAARLKPRLGVFASPGNHEYYRGIGPVRRTFDRGPVPLLIEQGVRLELPGGQIYLMGADDPTRGGMGLGAPRGSRRARGTGEFLERTVDACLDAAPSDAFHILLSHRPRGFVRAAERGVALTLSGHTHGAQLGLGRRSVFEPVAPDQLLWGEYRRGRSRLYTTSGFGHWFPFRLGCPPEAPLIVLERGPSPRSDAGKESTPEPGL